MQQLPGRLRATTLGDLLGALHRVRANGTLELTEDGGRAHRVHLASGLVIAVEVDGPAPTLGDMLRRDRAVADDTLRRSILRAMASRRLLGDVLVNEFNVAPQVVGAALRRQIVQRLQTIERLADAQVRFRVAVRTPREALSDEPLAPDEFLAGRRRARDRATWTGSLPHDRPSEVRLRVDPARAGALHLLGLPANADPLAIKKAYRQLARAYHPDLHPHASDAERQKLAEHFAAVTEAYQRLSA
jgi:hypothetical protein